MAPLFNNYVSFDVCPYRYLRSIFFVVFGLVMARIFLIIIFFVSSSVSANWISGNSGSFSTTGFPELYCSTYPGLTGSFEYFSYDELSGDAYQCKAWGGALGTDPCEDELVNSEWNQELLICEPPPEPCEYGSISPDCAIDCPELNYTYYQEGILRYGTISGGQVGYGQQCPQPSFPPGTNGGCISTGAACDIDGGFHESAGIGFDSGSSGPAGDGSGDIIDSSTGGGFSGTDSGPGSGGGTTGDGSNQGSGTGGSIRSGTGGLTSDGSITDADAFCDINGNVDACLSDDQVNINGDLYQLCNDGRIANSTSGCDYAPHTCTSGQIDTVDGCFTLVQSAPPPNTPPSDTTITSTDPDTGITTTTTVTSSGTGDQQGEDPVSSASLSGNCSAAPSCSGDAIQCQILNQQWRASCSLDDTVSDYDCTMPVECSGDPINCEILKFNQSRACELADSTQATNQINGAMSAAGLVDVDTVEAELLANGYERDREIDLSGSLVDLNSIPTTSGTCPADISISLGGNFGDIQIDLAQFCTFFTWIGYLVRLAAAILAFNMIFNTIREI